MLKNKEKSRRFKCSFGRIEVLKTLIILLFMNKYLIFVKGVRFFLQKNTYAFREKHTCFLRSSRIFFVKR